MAYHNGDGRILDRTRGALRLAGEAVPSIVLSSVSRRRLDLRPAQPRSRSPFPEIDCVANRLPLKILANIKHRAIEVGVGADRALITSGIMDEDTYLDAL